MKNINNIIGSKRFLHTWTIVYVVFLCINIFTSLYHQDYLTSHCYADMFINYQGGFVRRGLLGEILLQFYNIGINPYIIAISLSFLSYLIIAYYMATHFLSRGYDICLLTITPFLGGFCQYGFEAYRRDFMVMAVFLLIVQLWKRMSFGSWLILGNIIFGITLLCYEPFIFFALPFVIALTKVRIHTWEKSIYYWIPSICIFTLTCIYSGGKPIYDAIVSSTSPFLENPGIMNFLIDNSKDVMLFHAEINLIHGVSSTPSLLTNLWMLFCMIYFAVNAIAVYTEDKRVWKERCYILTSLLFVMLFLSPMFTVLSIDYARIFTYAVLSTFIIYFSLNEEELSYALPSKIYKMSNYLIALQDKYIKPTPTKMMLIMLFVGLSQCSGMGFMECLKSSQLGTMIRIIYHQLQMILS